jgi:hypothetical protein
VREVGRHLKADSQQGIGSEADVVVGQTTVGEVVENICIFDWRNPVGWVCGAYYAGKRFWEKMGG